MTLQWAALPGVLLGLISAAPTFGQVMGSGEPARESERSGCLAFDTALDLSLKNSPRIALSKAHEGVAEAEARTARSLFRPQVSAFARTGEGDVGLIGGVVQNQAGLRISQRVFDFGDSKFARRAAAAGVAASESETAAARLASVRQTGFAYIEAQEAAARLAAVEERYAYYERLLSATDKLLARGGATLPEKLNVSTRRANAATLVSDISAVRARSLARVAVETGLSAPLCDEFPAILEVLESADAPAEPDGRLEAAMAENPEVVALRHRLTKARAEEQRVRANRFPIIEVVGVSAYSSVGGRGDFNRQDWVGIDLSVPLYGGGRLSAQRDRASALSRAAAAEVAEAQRDLEVELRLAVNLIEAQRKQLVTLGEAAASSLALFDASRRQFDAGLKTLPELIEDRVAYENAQLALIEMRFDLLRQLLQLSTLTGNNARH